MIGGGIVGITTALLLAEAGASVVLLEARPARRRHERLHDREGLLAARPDLRRAALESTAPRRRAATARRTRRRSRGSRRASSATGSTATSAASPSYAYVDVASDRAAGRAGGATRRSRPGCPRRSWRRRRCRTRVEAAVRFDAPGRVPSAQVPVRARRAAAAAAGARVFERSHAVEVGRHDGSPGRQDAGRARARRARGRRDALSVPRPLARVRAAASRALLRDRVPHRRRAAGGNAHQRRQRADALGARGAARGRARRGAAARRRRGPQDGHRAATPSCATSGSRRSRASTGTCAPSSTAGRRRTRSTLDRCPYVGPHPAAQRPRADGDRLRASGG